MEQCSSEEWCVIARPRSKPDVAACLACCGELREIHAGRNITKYVTRYEDIIVLMGSYQVQLL